MGATGTEERRHASKAHPCPVCGGVSRCSELKDGLLFCRGNTGPVSGFVHMGPTRRASEFHLYRREGDPRLRSASDAPYTGPFKGRAYGDNGGRSNGESHSQRQGSDKVDWTARAAEWATALDEAGRAELSEALGLPEAVFASLEVGFLAEGPHRTKNGNALGPCWTFPERDGQGRIVGVTCRYADGEKKAYPGGKRGLAIPDRWFDRDGPVLLPEGASCTLAATALGLAAVGRPNDKGGVDQLVELLAAVPADRMIVVLGESDLKFDGRCPGVEGAKEVSGKLAAQLGRPVQWALPPAGAKDLRAWALSKKPDVGCADSWSDLGEQLLTALEGKYQQAPKPATTGCGFVWNPIDSAAFAQTDYRPTWLVKRLLVRGQPAIVGGPKKVLKTSLLVDLALSLAAGVPFAGEFEVYKPVRVAVLSGESGEYTLQETAFRVARARGVSLEALQGKLIWQFTLPQLANPAHLEALQAGLARDQVEALVFDPLYLSLLSGQGAQPLKAENLFDMGPLFMAITQACLAAGATPLLIHHTKRSSGTTGEPIDLDDLAYAGVAEFARQWLLVNRREAYEPGTGQHLLWLHAGGSTGQGGLWGVDVDEGVIDEDFSGRKWDVSVRTGTEARKAEAEAKRGDGKRKKQKEEQDEEGKLLWAVDRLASEGEVPTLKRVMAMCGYGETRFDRIVERLRLAKLVEVCSVDVPMPKGGTKSAEGLRRIHRHDETAFTDSEVPPMS